MNMLSNYNFNFFYLIYKYNIMLLITTNITIKKLKKKYI